MKKYISAIIIFVTGCVGIPENVTAVDNFELEKYLGTWYEIARLDHSFEKGLTNVSATYSLREDDGIKVINRGYNPDKEEWKEAEGRAYFVEDPSVGKLKVSFFRPFYGGYNIIALDKSDYNYSLICSNNFDYLWILARSKTLEKNTLDSLVRFSKDLGFPVDELIFVDQNLD